MIQDKKDKKNSQKQFKLGLNVITRRKHKLKEQESVTK